MNADVRPVRFGFLIFSHQPIDQERHRSRPGLIVAISGLLFVAILALRVLHAQGADASLILLVIPIAVCAIEFGTRGGVLAALIALILLVAWDLTDEFGWAISQGDELGLLGIATRATAFFVTGAVLGRFVDQRRALEAKVERHFDLSLDLFGTATFDGYFEDLNPAWEETLGYTTAELCSRPFIEFVHPDDRERTEAETARLASGERTVRFRNRYRTAEGDYRWLEWNVRPDEEECRLYATARDITVQRDAEQALQNHGDLLERTVRDRTQELERSRLEILQRLATAAEYRDDDTHQHTERVGRTAALIARELGLPDQTVAMIRRAAPLHDIGKVGIPDAILLKPGKLTAHEWKVMQGHVEIGAKILAGGDFAVLQLAREISLDHHERWDGTGYPYGLSGERISLAGRIVAVSDVFDALTHERPYKAAWPLADALAELERGSGSQFDPRVVEAFAALDHTCLLEAVEPENPAHLGPPSVKVPSGDARRLLKSLS